MWFEVPSIGIHLRVPENGCDKKLKKKLAKKIWATSEYVADEPVGGDCYESWFIA
jgi:hypothetical protein